MWRDTVCRGLGGSDGGGIFTTDRTPARSGRGHLRTPWRKADGTAPAHTRHDPGWRVADRRLRVARPAAPEPPGCGAADRIPHVGFPAGARPGSPGGATVGICG